MRPRTPRRGYIDRLFARQVFERVGWKFGRLLRQVGAWRLPLRKRIWPCEDYASAQTARIGAYVDNVIGSPHNFFVVFYYNYRVSEIAQGL